MLNYFVLVGLITYQIFFSKNSFIEVIATLLPNARGSDFFRRWFRQDELCHPRHAWAACGDSIPCGEAFFDQLSQRPRNQRPNQKETQNGHPAYSDSDQVPPVRKIVSSYKRIRGKLGAKARNQ